MSLRVLTKAGLGARTAVEIVRARYTLRRGGFPAALARYELAAVSDADRAQPPPTGRIPASVGVAVRILRAPVLGGTCLPTSLALASLLRRLGVPSDLVIGVAGAASDLKAHAWVEVGGRRLDVARLPPGSYAEIGRYRARQATGA